MDDETINEEFDNDIDLMEFKNLDSSFGRAYPRISGKRNGELTRGMIRAKRWWKRLSHHRVRQAYRQIARGYPPKDIKPITGWDIY